MSAPGSSRSLRRKLLFPLLGLGALVAALSVWGIYATAEQQLLEKLALRAELVAHAVNYAAENVSRESDLNRIVADLGSEKEVTAIVVMGGTPARVLATTRHELLGKTSAELPDRAMATELEEAIRTRIDHRDLHRESSAFHLASPLLLSRTDLAHRALSEGAVLVHLDLRATEAEIRQSSLKWAAVFLAILAGLTAFGFTLLNLRVLRPIAALVDYIRHRKEGSERFWVQAATNDGFGALARTLREALMRSDSARLELERQRAEILVLFDLVPAMIWFKDTKNCFLRVNRRAAEATGLVIGEIEGKSAEEIFPQQAAGYYADDLEVIQARAPKLGIVEKLQGPEGEELWVQTDKVPYFDQEGNVIGLVALVHDVTARIRNEVALQESEARFRGTFEQASVGIAHVSTEGYFLRVNDKLCAIVGYAREELLGLTFAHLTLPGEQAASQEARRAMLAGERSSFTAEKRYRRKNGGLVWINLIVTLERTASGEPKYFTSIAEEIGPRKEVEESLQRSQVLLRMAGRIARMGAWSVDLPKYQLTWSDEVCAIHELPPGSTPTVEQAIGYFSPEYREQIAAAFEACVRDGTPYDVELQILTATGRRVWVRSIGEAERDEAGVVRRVQGTFQDISDRKEAANSLLESERFLQSTLDALSSHIAILDEEGVIIGVNAAWNQFADANQAKRRRRGLGDNYLRLCDSARGPFSEEAAPMAAGIRAVMAGETDAFELEYPCHAPCEQRWFLARVTRFTTDGRVRVVVAHDNISARKRAELALSESKHFAERIAENSTSLVYLFDLETRTSVYRNRNAAESVGYSEAEIATLGDNFLSTIIHPEDLPQVLQQQARFAEVTDNRVLDLEFRVASSLF